MDNFIKIKGAREHNLKNINLEIPKGKMVVFSGVSGSGKSSLAMDTLYAEGQRRYVESLSSYARQFLGMMPRPDVDTIEGLSPSIAIDQHGLSHNPRSTVGTVTEIYDYLRVLFARIGHPHCPTCNREVARQSGEQIARQIKEIVQKELKKASLKQLRIMILSPIVRDKRGEYSKLFSNLKNKGFDQVRIDGRIYDLTEDLLLIKTNRHNIDVVVDKIALNKKQIEDKEINQRIKDDVEIALELADGLAALAIVNDKSFEFPHKPELMVDYLFSSRFACPECNLSLPEIEPRIFSFNSPFGACPECNGLGLKLKIDRAKVPNEWRANELEKRYYYTTSEVVREEIEKLMIKETCPLCSGARLKKESLMVTIDKQSIAHVSSWGLERLFVWTTELKQSLESSKEQEIAGPVLKEIISRLSFLIAVGVGYLTLERQAATLSVGEGQRIRLASQVGSGLTGVLYILDEPTVGLHARDTQKLIDTLKKLRDLGNTLVVVEHDEKLMDQADWIVDFGPGAGRDGGKIVAQGTLAQIKKDAHSLTGRYLSGKEKVKVDFAPSGKEDQWLTLKGCTEHNLKNISVKIPLGKLVCVTGVSGSGKSTLVADTLYPALRRAFNSDYKEKPGQYTSLTGQEHLNQALFVDQSPIGRTSRSNPATYINVFADIRNLMAQTREAKMKGFGQGFFSFNTVGGRCEACEGQGQLRVSMQFLPDIWVECEECHGKRFKQEVLDIEFNGKNIADILKMTVKEARVFFDAITPIFRKLEVLERIGLDYLQLGQPSPTLSGGESQRLKLARELVKHSEGKTLYLLDEPTTGLHFHDLKKLLYLLRALVARGDTVLLIEHNLSLIKESDWLIDLGPEGGEAGGKVLFQGTPQEILKNKDSWTAKYLKES